MTLCPFKQELDRDCDKENCELWNYVFECCSIKVIGFNTSRDDDD